MPKPEAATEPTRRVDRDPAELRRERLEALAKEREHNRDLLRQSMSPAMRRLEHVMQTPEYTRAINKKRLGGQLTAEESKALADAQRNYNIARVGEPRRADRRHYDGQPQTPALAEDHSIAFELTREIAAMKDPLDRKNAAREAILDIQRGENRYSEGYRSGDKDTVANVEYLYGLAYPDGNKE